MYPYITLWAAKVYMTWIGIIIAFLTFLVVTLYLTKKTYQNFWKFFYWLPFLTISMYVLWVLTTFMLEKGSSPSGIDSILGALSPYGYNFHFVWLLIGIIISLFVFFKRIIRIENKKAWIDILFFSFSLAIIPLGIFLMLWDNFIWIPTDSFIGIKGLHMESQLNKFISVYPIGLFLSIWALISAAIVRLLKITKKRKWYGILWFAILLFFTNIVFLFQQYPRYWVISVWNTLFDIKQYFSFLVIMWCLYLYNKRIYSEPPIENTPTSILN